MNKALPIPISTSILIFLLAVLTGCTTVSIPSYLHDKNPYKKTFYSAYDQVLNATKMVLEDKGWVISGTSDPSVYERNKVIGDFKGQSTLIFTDVRQMGLFFGSRYARVNVYVTENPNNATEVEVRYLTVNSMTVKTFENYKHDASVKNIFNAIEKRLQ